jgi:hypothetical protein
MRRPNHRTLGLVLCAVFALVACGGREERAAAPPEGATPPVAAAPAAAPFRVGAIQVGAAVDAAKRVTAPQASFAPGDTIYASVETQGASPGATLTVRWLYQDGQLVNESSQTLRAGANVSEFHIAKPSGWPAGSYRVEVLAGGSPAGSRTFEVR